MNVVCGSGLNCVNQAAQMIMAGDADVVVAGGMENMSMAPYAVPQARYGYRMNNGTLVDCMIKDALWDAFNDYHMITTADNICREWGLTREELDEFALKSQLKAEEAQKTGAFEKEIVPVMVKKKKEMIEFKVDEGPRHGSTIEGLAKLRTINPDGFVTAGNASGINDGAAAVVVMSEEKAKELGVKPMATFVAGALAGVRPEVMGIGPVASTKKVMAKTGMKLLDIRLELPDAVSLLHCFMRCRLRVPRPVLQLFASAVVWDALPLLRWTNQLKRKHNSRVGISHPRTMFTHNCEGYGTVIK